MTPESARRPLRGMLVAFAAALAFYLASMSPGVWWGDSAQLSRGALSLEMSPVARGYPLHALLCFAAGKVVGDAAVGANLVSVVCGALTVAFVYEAGRRLGGRTVAGVAAASTIAVAHTFWMYSVVAEVYTLHTALVLGALFVALRLGAGTVRARVALGALLALSGLMHHRMTVFMVPALAYWAWTATPRPERARAVGQVFAGVALGTLPFAALCVVASRTPPPEAPSALRWWFDDVFLGGGQNASYLLDAGKKTFAESASYLAKWFLFNLPGPALVFAAVGFVASAKRDGARVAVFLGLLVAAHLWFPLRYDWTGDQYTFLVPLYPFMAVAAGIGVGAAADRYGARIGAASAAALGLAPAALYAALATTSLGEKATPALDAAVRRQLYLPVRRGVPRPDELCAAKLGRLPKDASLLCDWGDGEVFLYLQETRGLRTDVAVRVFYDRIAEDPTRDQWLSIGPYAGKMPSALAPLAPRLVDEGGGLFRVAPK